MRRIKICILIITIIFIVMYVKNVYRIIKYRDKKANAILKVNEEKLDIKKVLTSKKDKIIIIDPGHGGKDPGKVGENNELEKDINLAIAIKLRDKLVNSGFSVVMTRIKDVGLYGELDRNKKNADLRNRVNIINESDAIAAISIHQNAYSSNKEKGAQVFYYNKSSIASELAQCVQNSFKEYHDEENKRTEKANESYYLLKKTIKPTIIVESGFLSNPSEAKLLNSKEYQESIAQAICNGIIIWANKIIESIY